MDWGRAKTILIWLFVVLNLFLGIQLYLRDEQMVVLSNQQIEDVKTILETNNIVVEAEIPRRVTAQPSLSIDLESPDIPQVLQTLREKGYEQTKEDVYKKQQEQITIKNTVELIYTSPGTLFVPSKFTEEEARRSADNMLKFMGLALKQYKPVEGVNKDFIDSGEFQFQYYRVFKGKAIYNSEIQIRVNQKGITYVRIATMKPHLYEEKVGIRPPTEALIQVLRTLQRGDFESSISAFSMKQPHYITDISFGYFVDQKNGQWHEGATGTALKVWRIVLDQQYVIYVNAVDMGVILEV